MAKTKKMTLKQFKEVFEKAGFNFDVWGYEGILNLIESHEWYEYHHFKDENKQSLADMAHERIDIIHDELVKIGYYDL